MVSIPACTALVTLEIRDIYRTLTRPWPPFTAYHHAFQGLNEV